MTKPPIRAILEHYGIDLPASGRREVSIRCPVHDETHPSCSVNEDEGLFNCQACGAAGDSFTLIMLKENCDYPAALKVAESITGESCGEVSRPAGRRSSGLSGGSGAGFKPRYRNSPPRRRPLSAGGA